MRPNNICGALEQCRIVPIHVLLEGCTPVFVAMRFGLTLSILLSLPNILRSAGTTGAGFLRAEQSARVVGMGGAFVAVADDGDAVYSNPGGLGFVQNRMLRLTHHQGIIDLKQNFLAGVYPVGKMGTLGINLFYSSIADVNIYDHFGIKIQEAKNYDFVVDAAWGSKITDHSGVGIGLKVFASRLAEARAMGVAMDVGVLFHPRIVDGSSIGLAIQNLGPGLTYISSTDPLPLNLRFGLSYKRSFASEHGLRISFETSRILYKYELYYPSFGLEYDFRKVYFFRAGYRFNRLKDKFSLGLGLGASSFQIDYSLLPFGSLGASHRFTLGLQFARGKPGPNHPAATLPLKKATSTAPIIPSLKLDHTTKQNQTGSKFKFKFQLPGHLLFQSGKSAFSVDGIEALKETYQVIQDNYVGKQLLIVGHTDDTKLESTSVFSSNYDLSVARAEDVKKFLGGLGFPTSLIITMGLGETKPQEANDSIQGKTLNRRVEILIYEDRMELIDDLMRESIELSREEQYFAVLYTILKVAELNPDDPKVFRILGHCYYQLGYTKWTIGAFERVLELVPDDEDLKLWLEEARK